MHCMAAVHLFLRTCISATPWWFNWASLYMPHAQGVVTPPLLTSLTGSPTILYTFNFGPSLCLTTGIQRLV